MLKSFSILKRNGGHLVEKKYFLKKNTNYPFLRFEFFEHAIFFNIRVKL
jgi:hypothetical protein